MLNRSIFMGLIFAALMAGFGPARAEGFLSAAHDIPLASGLVEVEDGMLVFDKPQGRIVQLTTMRQGVSLDAAADFYRTSLPNLGWRLANESDNLLTFTRQQETLRLTFSADLVIFDVTPITE